MRIRNALSPLQAGLLFLALSLLASGCATASAASFQVAELCNGLTVTIDMSLNGGDGQGTAGDDVILGTSGDDVISAGEGNDVVCAGAGDDIVRLEAGNDVVFGEEGADKLFGAQGADTMSGGDGDDVVHGNRGNDVLDGGDGNDRMFGYADDDVLRGGDGDDRLHGNFGDDTIDGGVGDDRIFGYGDNDLLNGGVGDDLLTGNFGDDTLNGDAGNDILYGADGDDIVAGGDGDDVLNGNSLNDTLTGGAGVDHLDGGIDTDTCDGGEDADTYARCETQTAEESTGVGSLSCTEIAAEFVTKGSANANLADPEVSAVCTGDDVVVTANGIPDFVYIATSPGDPDAFVQEYTFPATPVVASELTFTDFLGALGVAINGVPIFGATEGTGGDVLSLAGGFTECGGHNGPTGYHFHTFDVTGTDDCLFSAAEAAAGHVLFGYALDGYPIYSGNVQYTSSYQLTNASMFATDTWSAHTYVAGLSVLDECNGLTDEDGNYAYYTTDTFPYTVGCYRGEVEVNAADGGPGGGGPGGGGPGGP